MSTTLVNEKLLSGSVLKLFEEKSPILVEVRFPGMATASDWYLCSEIEELKPILERLATKVVVHLASVHDARFRETLQIKL